MGHKLFILLAAFLGDCKCHEGRDFYLHPLPGSLSPDTPEEAAVGSEPDSSGWAPVRLGPTVPCCGAGPVHCRMFIL